MNKKLIRNKFIDLTEGKLNPEEAQRILREIESDPSLKSDFKQYTELLGIEKSISTQKIELSENFTVKVMDRLESTRHQLFWSTIMKFLSTRRLASAGLATCVVALLIFKLTSSEVRQQLDLKQQPPASEPIASVTTQADKGLLSGSTKLKSSDETILSDAESKAPAEIGNQAIITEQKPLIAQKNEPSVSTVQAANTEELKKNQPVRLREESLTTRSLPPAPVSKESGTIFYDSKVDSILSNTHISPVEIQTNEKYGQYSENQRIAVSTDPVSTFSIDVDTGSYTNARRFIRLGQLPPADSIRTEEFLNYFQYSYPKQTKEPFAVYSEIAPSPLEPKKYLLKLGVKTKDIEESSKAWNLVFLVDVSGSMQSDDKLGLLKQSLKLLVNNMRSKDKISIVTYAGSAGTLLEAAGMEEKSTILQTIESLSAGGSTYGSGGIIEAYRIAQKHLLTEGENRVILASDGDFNVGVTSTAELIKLIEEKRKAGVTLTTLGFGTNNYNEELTEQLANKGNGNYFYIDSFKEAKKVFETDLFSTIETVAKDVKIQIEFNPQHVSSYRLIGYDNRKLNREDFNNDQIDAGETGSGHTVTVLYEIALKGSEFEKELVSELRYAENKQEQNKITNVNPELAFLKIRYKEPKASESKLLTFPIERSIVKNSTEQASSDFKFAASVSYFAHLLRNSQYKGSYTYSDIAKLSRDNLAEDTAGYRREFSELAETVASLSK